MIGYLILYYNRFIIVFTQIIHKIQKITFLIWRRKWQPTPLFLPGESHGQRSLAGVLWGHRSRIQLSDQRDRESYSTVPWKAQYTTAGIQGLASSEQAGRFIGWRRRGGGRRQSWRTEAIGDEASCRFTHAWHWWNAGLHLWKFAIWRFICWGCTQNLFIFFRSYGFCCNYSTLILWSERHYVNETSVAVFQ